MHSTDTDVTDVDGTKVEILFVPSFFFDKMEQRFALDL